MAAHFLCVFCANCDVIAKIFGRETLAAGIEGHLARLAVAGNDVGIEAFEEVLVLQQPARLPVEALFDEVVAERGYDVHQQGHELLLLRHTQALHAHDQAEAVADGFETLERQAHMCEIGGKVVVAHDTLLTKVHHVRPFDKNGEHAVVGTHVGVGQHVVGNDPANVASLELEVAIVVATPHLPAAAKANVVILSMIVHVQRRRHAHVVEHHEVAFQAAIERLAINLELFLFRHRQTNDWAFTPQR